MARQTTNYGFNISEGTDLVNPLTDIFPNFEDIDTDLKGVSDSAVGTATELLTGTVHALVRSDSDRNVFTFTATSNFEAGETFTLDGVQVTALTPDGQTLSTGCYIIGSEVLVAVKGTLMTVYVNPSKALDSDKLDGHDSTYYATASDVSDLSGDVSTLSSKVGIETLTVGNDCVDGINTLNGRLTQVQTQIVPTASIEKGATASKAYNVGDFLVKDGILYKVTNAITKGGALTVGTNIVMTTVGGELSEMSNLTYRLETFTVPSRDYNTNRHYETDAIFEGTVLALSSFNNNGMTSLVLNSWDIIDDHTIMISVRNFGGSTVTGALTIKALVC